MTVEHIGAYEAKTHLPKLLDRVAHGESLTITRHGKPVARLVPVATPREQAERAATRIEHRRRCLKGASVAALIKTVHEGHTR